MPNSTLNDSVNTRIAVLEVIVIDLKKDRDHHSSILETMSVNNQKMAMALERISTQLSTGIKGIGVGFVLMTTLVSAGWIYQQNLDAKIAKTTQTLTVGLGENTQTLVTHGQKITDGAINNTTNEEKSHSNSDRIDRVENNKVDKAQRYLK
jgi:hypothetical protein